MNPPDISEEYDEVLNTLKRRYIHERSIYTWCGIALVAVNPYQEIDIYNEKAIETYHGHSSRLQLQPHLYQVCQDAYVKLERDGTNQSIIVSGESGAGKTMSAKYSMRFFASIASGQSTDIDSRVLASNPIMEAIGNARTVRNDNSSRFGKYIQILFNKRTRKLLGGNMRTYLLEKSRVCAKHQQGERNFHIFHQLVEHAQSSNELDHLKLDAGTKFKFLGDYKLASGRSGNTNEQTDLTKFCKALKALDIDDKRRDVIFKIIAAILHAGNIEFKSIITHNDADGHEEVCKIDPSDKHFIAFCELLGLDKEEADTRLTTKLLKLGAKETITKPLKAEQAEYGRDAMLKYVYERMFAWIVALINMSLGYHGPTLDTQFIGVLDIYGFENFASNSFEQFCINYANEVLQQQFNQHVFKLEQEEYISEGIDWTYIEFTDNQPVIDLIEAKPIGILNLLDEECKMPKGTDETWCAKLYSQLATKIKNDNVFQKPKMNYQKSFMIKHFAERVTYQVGTFLEKNRDTVSEEQLDVLKQSNQIDLIFEDPSMTKQVTKKKVALTPVRPAKSTPKSQSKATVGSQFRESLTQLICILNQTEPHYIRCIKPNDSKAAFVFDDKRAEQQLIACGVYETIRISTNGFPSRWQYKDFAKRYCVLLVGTKQVQLLESNNNHIIESSPQSHVLNAGARPRTNSTRSIENLAKVDPLSVCRAITHVVYVEDLYANCRIKEEDDYQRQLVERYGSVDALCQFGKTKLFFRAGQVPFLERIRSHKLNNYTITIQRHIRGWMARLLYVRLLEAAKEAQRMDSLNQENELQAMGMLCHDAEQEDLIVDIITNQAEELVKHGSDHLLPAHAIFMCIRYIDHINDEIRIHNFLIKILAALKRIAARTDPALETMFVWLVNTCKIVNYLRQYSIEDNPHGEFEETLKNFDLSDFRLLFDELVDLIYQSLTKLIYAQIQPLIINAVLEHEGLDSGDGTDDLSGSNVSLINSHQNGTAKAVFSTRAPSSLSPTERYKPMKVLLNLLNHIHDLINSCDVYPEIALQIYKQIFYLICAISLNQLLLRKDLCHWKKAMQIRYNLSCLEQWCRDKRLFKWQEIVKQLDPITQSTKLLQTIPSLSGAEHIVHIAEMCKALRPTQIITILNLYTSSHDEQISVNFIKELQEYLLQSCEWETQTDLFLNPKLSFPISVAYKESSTRFQDVQFPEHWIEKGLPVTVRSPTVASQ